MVELTKKEKENLNVRSRSFTIQRNYYYDTHDENGVLSSDLSEAEWRNEIIRTVESQSAKEKWLIFHDKDRNDDGTEKGLHCHGIIIYKNARTVSVLCDEMKLQSRNVLSIKKDSGAFRYLIHVSDGAFRDKKHIYSVEELYSWVDNEPLNEVDKREMYSERCKAKEKNSDAQKQNEVISEMRYQLNIGELQLREVQGKLQKKFGDMEGTNLYLKYVKEFNLAVEERYNRRIREKESGKRNLDTIYISGASGVGKTYFADEFAEYLAKKNSYDVESFYQHSSASKNSGNYYMLEEYNGEPVLILNDIDGSHFSYDEFKTRFEPTAKKAPSVPNRYKNKKFIADLCLITYSKGLLEWSRTIIDDGLRYESDRNNVAKQVLRRIGYWVELNKDDVVIKKFNSEEVRYDKIKVFKMTVEERRDNLEEIFEYLSKFTSLG